ncbi:MAG: glutamate--tRNA ligase [Patescibacteria group bacterium]|nr:glutamate--tRNA ligase [Patescibacteria group bacterium]
MVRVRFAPSPTGIPHIGNTRSALFNYLFAKHNNGKFILRIEDTDRARFVPESEPAIYDILNWLELKWDEKYVQSERLEIYKKFADQLIEEGTAYKEDGAVKFKMPELGKTDWTDAVGNKKIEFKNEFQEDFVLIKSDGYPTYNFANVIDDHLMEITHVIRGDEFISSTPKHIQLYKAFGWDIPVFAHLPVIVGSDHQKLSKRHGAKSVLDYKKDGYLKEALINFMVLLGWNPGEDREILNISEMIKLFDLKDINTASPVFDNKKLEWMNGIYIRQLPVDELKSRLSHDFGGQAKLKNIDDVLLEKIVSLAQTRMTTLNDFYLLSGFIFENPKIALNSKEKEIAKELLQNLSSVSKWKQEEILKSTKEILFKNKIKMSAIYKIITGRETGLPLPQILEIIGKEKTVKLLENYK